MTQHLLEDTLQRTATSWGTATIVDYEEWSGDVVVSTLDADIPAPTVEVTDEKVQDAALRFKGQKVTILNFASGVNPGGGVRNGAKAQEEDLCRCSGLLHGLERLPQYYEWNRSKDAPPESYDTMIVSEDVPVVRDGYGRLVDPPVTVAVLTYPAPNRNRGFFSKASYRGSDFHCEDDGPPTTDDLLLDIFDRRCNHVVDQAVRLGTDVLILGPWGCGVYGNDPIVVAKAFKSAIENRGASLKHVLFACYGSLYNRDVFRAVFDGSIDLFDGEEDNDGDADAADDFTF